MSDTTNQLERLYQKVENYTKTSVLLYKLNAVDRTADIVSSLASRAVIAVILTFITLFLSIALSVYLGNLLGDISLGFVVVSGLYLIILGVILLFKRKLIINPVSNNIIATLLKPDTSRIRQPKVYEDDID
ncbi:MAG: hypothetical protein ABNH00_10690 [Dokdonia sp.]|jgi:hypothetical protein|nr:hypothetical protein [Cytophagaceae bacterium]